MFIDLYDDLYIELMIKMFLELCSTTAGVSCNF